LIAPIPIYVQNETSSVVINTSSQAQNAGVNA